MNTIDKLRAQYSPVKGSKFNVSIQFPVFLAGQLATEQINIFCQATTIPSGSTDMVEVFHRGSSMKIAGDNTYPDWTVTVKMNVDYNIYKTIQRWREFMRSDILGTHANDLTYKTIATIEQLDGADNVIFTEVLVGIFPTVVGDVTLGDEERSNFEIFDLTFAYDYTLPQTI